MGEANMAYVHGDISKAIRICQEVITNGLSTSHSHAKSFSSLVVPNAAEPYLTIARIYEDQNDHDKAFEVRTPVLHNSHSAAIF